MDIYGILHKSAISVHLQGPVYNLLFIACRVLQSVMQLVLSVKSDELQNLFIAVLCIFSTDDRNVGNSYKME